jgi:hypothetical protein
MFVVTQKPTFSAPVIVNRPADGGTFERAEFSVIFKALKKSEIDTLLAHIRQRAKVSAENPDAPMLKDREIIDKVLAGFGPEVVDKDEIPLPFTTENVDALCELWMVEPAIIKSFFDNYVNASAKN